ncbi:hypothetical protein [Paenibacillus cremeus]|uniref:hypothetical protein n=1 Tax=Paenibacillus cremeus TaxID=2163881 RepID=UPI0016454307|nr:hypothetical protein [Paenibacillus cremeus]
MEFRYFLEMASGGQITDSSSDRPRGMLAPPVLFFGAAGLKWLWGQGLVAKMAIASMAEQNDAGEGGCYKCGLKGAYLPNY